jgi:hypothetical protein
MVCVTADEKVCDWTTVLNMHGQVIRTQLEHATVDIEIGQDAELFSCLVHDLFN